MRARRLALLGLALVSLAPVAGCGEDSADTAPPVKRVLVFSMPGVSWNEVGQGKYPNLDKLVDRSAIASVSTRIGRFDASTTAAYLTIGAGTRAVVPGVDTGVALNPDELHAGIPATQLLQRRLGKSVDGIAYIPMGATLDANEESLFGGVPGTLGDALSEAGVHRAVIANVDSAEGFPTDQPLPEGAFSRSAAAALMGTDGVVPGGTVGRGLLIEDPAAPFGRRLNADTVLREFDEEWGRDGQSVVLVEASDLARATGYRSRATPAQATKLRTEALASSDELLGRLLERVDPDTDAVVVLAPVTRTGLGVAAVSSPTVSDGLLTSASTRRDGYVYLADVAPTLLEMVGQDPPDDIEGRAFIAHSASGDRVEHLANEADDAVTRGARLWRVVPGTIAALLVLVIAMARRDRLGPGARSLLLPGAIAIVGIVPATFLAGRVPATRSSDLAYLAFIVAFALLVGLVGTLAERRRAGTGILVGLGSVLVVIGGDIVVGSPLQVNTVFGYSMVVAGRFTGLGNLAFAMFASAAVCFAVMTYEAFGPRAVPAIIGGLAVIVLIDGLPALGADVGGVTSVVPAFILTVLALLGQRIGWRQLAASVIAAAAIIAVLGLIDTSRPAGAQTHLARVGEHLAAGRFGSVGTILWRRVSASFGNETVLIWLLALVIIGLALAQAVTVARGAPWPRALQEGRSRTSIALAFGLGAVAGLGLVLNDSSIAVPATMLIVIVPVLVARRLSSDALPALEPSDAAASEPSAAAMAGAGT